MRDRVSSLPERIRNLPNSPGKSYSFVLAAPGCDVHFEETPAGTKHPTHTHNTDNVTAILSGEVAVTIDGQEHRYGAGEWYQTAAGEPHAVRFDVDTVLVELRFAT